VQKALKKMNLREILVRPETELTLISEEIAQAAIDSYARPLILEGLHFAKEVEKKRKKIEFIKSDNPGLNKDAELQGEIPKKTQKKEN